MLIEAGKFYKRRDGNVSGMIIRNDSPTYPFMDNQSRIAYTKNGQRFLDCIDNMDLITTFPSTPITPTQAEEILIPSGQKAKSDKVGVGLVLIPWYSILAVGKIFIEGLRYGRDNWKNGVNDKDYQEERLEHAMLHLLKWKEGDRTEEHLAKVAWFCLTQLELERLECQRNPSPHQ